MPGVLVARSSARTPVSLSRSRSTPTPLAAVFAVHDVSLLPSTASFASVKSSSGRAYGLYVRAASAPRSTATSLAELDCFGAELVDGFFFAGALAAGAGVLGVEDAGGAAAGGVAGLAALGLAGLLGLAAAGGVALVAGGGVVCAGGCACVCAGSEACWLGAATRLASAERPAHAAATAPRASTPVAMSTAVAPAQPGAVAARSGRAVPHSRHQS